MVDGGPGWSDQGVTKDWKEEKDQGRNGEEDEDENKGEEEEV